MQKQDFTEFAEIMNRAALLTFRQKGNDWQLMVLAMFEELTHYGLEDVRAAVAGHVHTQKFMPTLADIVNRIEGNPADKSVTAWRHLLRAMARWGYYDSVRFPDPAYHYAIGQLGGWVRLCEEWGKLTDKELEFRSRDFRTLYEIGLRAAVWGTDDELETRVQVPQHLPGFHELGNGQNGYEEFIPLPVDTTSGDRTYRKREALQRGDDNQHLQLVVGGVKP